MKLRSNNPSGANTSSPPTSPSGPSPAPKPTSIPIFTRNPHVPDSKLDFWIKSGVNVLLKGKRGTGKTSKILAAFERNNLRWKYFSGGTMDPWIELIGVPKERTDDNGESYLDLVRPRDFQRDEVDAVLLDEFNRSRKAVRNAVMELIQFKSINGKKFHNLKIVWAAINPDDDEDETYDVEPLDPAQLDRFEVHVDIPYFPDVDYFVGTYGHEVGMAAIEWWKDLPQEIKNKISPRRLEYALKYYRQGGDLTDIVDKKSNIRKLTQALNDISMKSRIENIFSSKNTSEAKSLVTHENSYATALNYIFQHPKYIEFFLPLIPEEKLMVLMSNYDSVLEYMIKNRERVEVFGELINEARLVNLNRDLVQKINHLLK